jgi:hypothetical protein
MVSRRLRPVEWLGISLALLQILAIVGCLGAAVFSGPPDDAADRASDRQRAVAQPVTVLTGTPLQSTGVPAASTSTSAGEPSATTAGVASPAPAVTPAQEKRTVTETQPVPFGQRTIDDPALPRGIRQVRTAGVPGVKTLTYEVTYSLGAQVDKKLISESVTRAPVTEVVAVGTKATSTCDPNYSGACVPIASDVDCAGGSGDGPAYVRGPVTVVGTDIYDLDHDNDGVGCE